MYIVLLTSIVRVCTKCCEHLAICPNHNSRRGYFHIRPPLKHHVTSKAERLVLQLGLHVCGAQHAVELQIIFAGA
jgi:hypothetical protein